MFCFVLFCFVLFAKKIRGKITNFYIVKTTLTFPVFFVFINDLSIYIYNFITSWFTTTFNGTIYEVLTPVLIQIPVFWNEVV